MKRKPAPPLAALPLRRQAEAKLRARAGKNHSEAGVVRSVADTQRLLHELQVHQMELEMQNEELRKARDQMEAGLDKYSELYDFAPVGYLTLDREGAIREANMAAAALLGIPRAPLMKQRFGFFVAPAERPGFNAFLALLFKSDSRQECDVRLLVAGKGPVDVRIRANRFASGEACRLAISDITKHKLAEATTAQLAAIVNSSSDAIVGKDLNGIVTSWNAGAERLFGYSAREMIGRPIVRLVPPGGLKEEIHIMSSVRRGESVEHFETTRVRKDGQTVNVSLAVSPIRLAGGKIVGASKVARDITAPKLAEEKVRLSEVRYRRLFEAAHDGVLILDPATCKITDANPFMTKLLGYPRTQLIGKELFEIGLLKDEAASQAMFQKLTKDHEVRYEDLPLESREGRHQEVEVVANLYRENGHDVIQCNIRDITERKRTEAALHESQSQYRTLFESIDEGFCVIEMLFDQKGAPCDYRFLEVNPSFAHQTGIRDAVGKRVREIAPQLEAHWYEIYGRVALTGKPVRFVEEAKALSRWFDVYAFRLGDEKSRKVALLFSNITARKRVEAALSAARKKLSAHATQLKRVVSLRTAQLTATNRRLTASVETITKGREQYRSLLEESEFMQTKLRHLTRQFLTAQEDERREISRELHDEVVQSLVGINVALAALGQADSVGRGALKSKITRTQRLVERSVNAVHRFARELRPAALDDLGLIPALRTYVKSAERLQKLKIDLVADASVEGLDMARRTVLFRVAQEALTNVARHAQATAVRVSIKEIPGAFRMEVQDNGKSFQVMQTLSSRGTKRLGLLGMRERVEMVGGTLLILSAPGRGTTVRAEVPSPPPRGKLKR